MHLRRLNFLLLGEEEKKRPWKETKQQCLEKVQKYLNLVMPNAQGIQIIDCHRKTEGRRGWQDNISPNYI